MNLEIQFFHDKAMKHNFETMEVNKMSLKKYLEDNGIDQIEDDQEFMEAEYNAIQTYCENCGYCITSDDLNTIRSRGRGLEDSFEHWKETYVKDL